MSRQDVVHYCLLCKEAFPTHAGALTPTQPPESTQRHSWYVFARSAVALQGVPWGIELSEGVLYCVTEPMFRRHTLCFAKKKKMNLGMRESIDATAISEIPRYPITTRLQFHSRYVWTGYRSKIRVHLGFASSLTNVTISRTGATGDARQTRSIWACPKLQAAFLCRHLNVYNRLPKTLSTNQAFTGRTNWIKYAGRTMGITRIDRSVHAYAPYDPYMPLMYRPR